MKIEVSRAAPPDWDDYVQSHPLTTAYHQAGAVLLGRTVFGLDTFFLTARDSNQRVVGILPLVEQSSILFGRFLSSLPFVTYGGILGDAADANSALAGAASELARQRRAKHCELRHRDAVPGLDFQQRLDKVSMILKLPGDEETVGKALGSKLRSQIRRAERVNPVVKRGGTELVSAFFSVFTRTMHALGTPSYPRRFFEVFMNVASSAATIVLVEVDGKPEAAALVVRHGGQIEVPWAGASMFAKKNAINMRMYWEMLRYAIAEGATAFDFGRSTVDSGTYRFKAQWGAEPQQLHWDYWLPAGTPLPMLNPQNPKYSLAIRAWQRLPLWCVNLVGPRISRSLP